MSKLQYLKDGTVAMYDKKYHLHMFQPNDDVKKANGFKGTIYLFESRYFAQKFINENLVDRDQWHIVESEGYYKIFRLEEVYWPDLV